MITNLDAFYIIIDTECRWDKSLLTLLAKKWSMQWWFSEFVTNQRMISSEQNCIFCTASAQNSICLGKYDLIFCQVHFLWLSIKYFLKASVFCIGLFKVNLEFSFSFQGFSFSGLDLIFKSGFYTWDSLHISISVLNYFSAIADC